MSDRAAELDFIVSILGGHAFEQVLKSVHATEVRLQDERAFFDFNVQIIVDLEARLLRDAFRDSDSQAIAPFLSGRFHGVGLREYIRCRYYAKPNGQSIGWGGYGTHPIADRPSGESLLLPLALCRSSRYKMPHGSYR